MKFQSKASVEIGKRKKKDLAPIRDDLKNAVDKANQMVSQLIAMNNQTVNPAIEYAKKSASAKVREGFEKGEVELFSVNDKHRFRELKRESARMQEFLSMAENKPEVLKYEQKAIEAYSKHNISFHNQKENMERTGFRFGTTDEDSVKFALSIFREIKDSTDPAIFLGGSERFNSDTLFNLIYDAIEGYDPDMPEKDITKKHALAIRRARAAIKEQQKYTQGFLSGNPTVNQDVGILEKMKKAMSAEDFLNENNF